MQLNIRAPFALSKAVLARDRILCNQAQVITRDTRKQAGYEATKLLFGRFPLLYESE
jgi:hypothetical protein